MLEVLELFKKDRFCFAPIKTKEGKIVSVAARDLLPLVAKMKINIPIRTIYSKMIFVSEGIQIKDALDIMFNNQIRRLGIVGTEPLRIINDRDILEYLCFIKVLEKDVLIKKIDRIRSQQITDIHPNTSISSTAELLMANPPACSVEKHYIVTPYDIVNKTILSSVQV